MPVSELWAIVFGNVSVYPSIKAYFAHAIDYVADSDHLAFTAARSEFDHSRLTMAVINASQIFLTARPVRLDVLLAGLQPTPACVNAICMSIARRFPQ